MINIVFYDEKRAIIGTRSIGPWRGTFNWKHEHGRVRVPNAAREAIVYIGLLRTTGEISFDDVRISAATKGKGEK